MPGHGPISAKCSFNKSKPSPPLVRWKRPWHFNRRWRVGWRLREGLVAFKGARPIGAVDPVYAYPHKDGRCAVVGGALYRGSALPALVGWYVFGDVCTGQLSALRPTANGWVPMSLGARVSYLTAFGVGNDGELYATSLEGAVVKLVP